MEQFYPILIFFSFIIGFIVGSYQMASQWAANAERPQRKEWKGNLYKVEYDKES